MGLSETDESEPGKDIGATFSEEGNPMWVVDDGAYDVIPPNRSIAALCALSRFTNNQKEYFLTKRLVMDHLCARKGNE